MRKLFIGFCFGVGITMTGTAIGQVDVGKVLDFSSIRYVLNGEHKTMPEPYTTLNYEGHIYAPVRFIAEQFDMPIAYEPVTRSLLIAKEPLGIKSNGEEDSPLAVDQLTFIEHDGMIKLLAMYGFHSDNPDAKVAVGVAMIAFYNAEGKYVAGSEFSIGNYEKEVGTHAVLMNVSVREGMDISDITHVSMGTIFRDRLTPPGGGPIKEHKKYPYTPQWAD